MLIKIVEYLTRLIEQRFTGKITISFHKGDLSKTIVIDKIENLK